MTFCRFSRTDPSATTRELIEACQDYGEENWGKAAKALIKSWGIYSSSDVGGIVFLLVEAGVLRKRPEDTLEDFNGLPFMEDSPW